MNKPYSKGQIVNGLYQILEVTHNKDSYRYLVKCTRCPLEKAKTLLLTHMTVAFRKECSCIKKETPRLDRVESMMGTYLDKTYSYSLKEWWLFLKETYFKDGFLKEDKFMRMVRLKGLAQILEDLEDLTSMGITNFIPPFRLASYQGKDWCLCTNAWYQLLVYLKSPYITSLEDFKKAIYKKGLQNVLDSV